MKNSIIAIAILCFLLCLGACQEDLYEPDQFGDLFGEVFLSNSGIPMANVNISTNPPTSTILTDSEGRFSLKNIKAGVYSVRAAKDGFVTKVESVTVYGNQASNIIIQVEPDTANSTPPSPAYNPFPADGSTGQAREITLRWSAFDVEGDPLTFDVNIYSSNPQQSELVANQISDTMVTVTLAYATTYFWQVTTYDEVNDAVYSDVWQFTTEDFPDHRFLFARQVDGSFQIFSSDIFGNAIQLTQGAGNSWRPRVNPQRTKIAYISDVGLESHIFIMDRDGSNAYQLTSNVPIRGFNELELDFCWSPDGSKILYMNNANLYTIHTDGTGLALFTTATNNLRFIECDWTAQGNLVAARTIGSDYYDSFIAIYNGNGSFLTTVLNNPLGGSGGPMFSISATGVLYTQDASGYEGLDGRQLDARIYIRNLATNTVTDLSVNKPNGTNDLDAGFSPDGASVIFVNTNNDGISQRDIWKMDLDGNNRTLLFENAITPEWK